MPAMHCPRLLVPVLLLALPLSSSCKGKKEAPSSAAPATAQSTSAQSTSEPSAGDAAPAKPAPMDAKEAAAVAAEVKPAVGYHYFATQGGNHPTLFLDRASAKFVVVGRTRALGGSTDLTQAATNVEDALALYFKRLVDLGYKPQGAPKKEEPAPDAVVEVPLADLIASGPKAGAGLTEVQTRALYQMRPSDAWELFSGHQHESNDAPAVMAHGGGLMVFDPSGKYEFPWARSQDAFAKFVELSKRPPRQQAAKSAP